MKAGTIAAIVCVAGLALVVALGLGNTPQDQAGSGQQLGLVQTADTVYQAQVGAGAFVLGAVTNLTHETGVTVYRGDQEVRHFNFLPSDDGLFGFAAAEAGLYELKLELDPAAYGKTGLTIENNIPADTAIVRNEAVQADIQSPFLQKFAATVATNPAAESDFWAEVASSGAPLVEPLDDATALYSFLWKGSDMTRSVELSWAVWSPNRTDNLLKVIPGTDVWFKSVVLPIDVAMSYKLAPGISHFYETDPTLYRRLMDVAAQKDPLNSHHWRGEGVFEGASLLLGPKAAPLKWSVKQDGVPAGTVVTKQIKSTILGNSRDVAFYTPPGALPDTPLPLVMLYDGEKYLAEAMSATLLDNLIAAGKIPPVAAVFISNTVPSTRGAELPCNTQFADFMADELLPVTYAQIPAAQGTKDIITTGSSYGGLASACVNYFRPEVFTHVLSQSGAFWWSPDKKSPLFDKEDFGWMIRAFEQRACTGKKYYFNAGALETGYGMESIADTSEMLSRILEQQGCETTYRTFPGGHDLYHWRETLADGLIWLFADKAQQ